MNKKEDEKVGFRFCRLVGLAVMCLGLVVVVQVPGVYADDPADTGGGDDVPAYSNPAQAQHAANLAEAAATQPDAEIDAALSAIEQAEAELAEAERNGTQEEIAAARENLDAAREAYDDLVAERAGVLSKEITDMRNAGMGWGEIAHELGVHPGLLGLGHTKKEQHARGKKGAKTGVADIDMDEIAEATERNPRSGWSKGHGVGLGAGVKSTSGTRGGYAFGLAGKEGKKGGKGAHAGIGGASGLSGDKGADDDGGGNSRGSGNGRGAAGNDGSPGNSGNGHGNGGGHGKGNNKGGNSGHGKGGGKGK